MLKILTSFFSPNSLVPKSLMQLALVGWMILILGWWLMLPAVVPSPIAILSSFGPLWFEKGLGHELITSIKVNVQAMFIAVVISLGLAYLTVVPAVRPFVAMISKARFLGLTGLTFLFTLISPNAHQLKVWLLVFGMTVFYLTGMSSEVASIPKEKFNHARTLRMSEWRVVWEVVVLGMVDQALELLRQNASIGWMMLTMVEGLVMSGGGIGTLLIKQNKYFLLAEVFAIQLTILIVGMLQDYLLGFLKVSLCPYSVMKLERR